MAQKRHQILSSIWPFSCSKSAPLGLQFLIPMEKYCEAFDTKKCILQSALITDQRLKWTTWLETVQSLSTILFRYQTCFRTNRKCNTILKPSQKKQFHSLSLTLNQWSWRLGRSWIKTNVDGKTSKSGWAWVLDVCLELMFLFFFFSFFFFNNDLLVPFLTSKNLTLLDSQSCLINMVEYQRWRPYTKTRVSINHVSAPAN